MNPMRKFGIRKIIPIYEKNLGKDAEDMYQLLDIFAIQHRRRLLVDTMVNGTVYIAADDNCDRHLSAILLR